MPSLGYGELVLILVIALVVFGPGKLPGVGRAVGSAMREFRSAKDGIMNENEVNHAGKENKK
jgi:sec-independent protein translocase protein TatA